MIVTEIGIDTRTPTGEAMAHLAVVFAELEREATAALNSGSNVSRAPGVSKT